ncbi:TPM domain-containing protein [Roseateles sp.]|uniref:TPM domain-containing protein n=1 Tax=Roseateles sp. TaxID=1971397 RepID=UPI002E075A4A|nr:TPM domain-containing protein [Roseateles sp.]
MTLGQRILRHLFTTQHAVRAAFSSETLAAVEQAIRDGEQAHGGQLRFVVEGGLDGPPLWQGQPARERAVDLFSQLRIWDTEHNCGVLIYVLFADRAVEIVADRGIHACCGDQARHEVCVEMQSQFTEGRLAEGSLAGVRAVGELLVRHFPRRLPEETNELPDRPLLM